MGYELHVTRKDYWADEPRPDLDITLQEWLAYIDQDKQLELSNDYWIKVPGSETESQVAPGFCKWTHHPKNDRPYFDYSDGNISTKNPDDDTIQKMIEISAKLNAHVQGDDGEIYERSSSGNITTRHIESDKKSNDKKPWWKFW
jgi:hypothetical protein